MLSELKLLHVYLGGLIEEAEAGEVLLSRVHVNNTDSSSFLEVEYGRRLPEPPGCDHEFRGIASGEYECKLCGLVTDELEGEQWQS